MPESPRRRHGTWIALAGPVFLVAVWEVVARLHLFPESLFPTPFAVARGLVLELRSGRLVEDAVASPRVSA